MYVILNEIMDKAGTYIVKSTNYFFMITVSLEDGGLYNIKTIGIPSEISIESGSVINNPGMECVHIIVTVNENGSGFNETAELEYLTHGSSCGLSPVFTSGKDSAMSPLKNGDGTVELLNANMSFVSREFGVNRFSLFDESEFTCPGIDMGVRLSIHSTLIHKATWYNRKFSAKPEDISSNLEIAQTNMLLDEKFSTSELEQMMMGEFDSNTKVLFAGFERDGFSWTQAFGVINKTIGCGFFSGDVLEILSEKFLITDKSPWVIQVTDSQDVIVEYEKINLN